MKKLKLFFGLLLIVIASSCKQEVKISDTEKVLGGKHELRKFNVKTNTSTSTSAFYFLVVGSYSSTTTSNSIVRFYFKNHKDEFQLKEMPLNKVNIKIDSTVTEPYVKFYWVNNNKTMDNTSAMYDYDITKAVIFVKILIFNPKLILMI